MILTIGHHPTILGTAMLPGSAPTTPKRSNLLPSDFRSSNQSNTQGQPSILEKYLPKLSNLYMYSIWKDVTTPRSAWSLRDLIAPVLGLIGHSRSNCPAPRSNWSLWGLIGHFEIWLVHSALRSGRDRKDDSRFYSSGFPSTNSEKWKSEGICNDHFSASLEITALVSR